MVYVLDVMRPVSIVALWICACALGCADQQTRHERATRRMVAEGHRSSSRARRTAENRPKPWVEDKRPFDADRADIAPYRADKQARPDSAEPQLRKSICLRLQDAYPCPLLAHRWQVRDVQGGVELRVKASARQAARLREFVRCHHVHGRHDKHDPSCLRQFSPVRATGGYRGGEMWLRLTFAKRPAEAISALRGQVRALVAEAL